MLLEPKVGAVWARLIVERLNDAGVDSAAALKEAGLTRRDIQGKDNRIPTDKNDKLYEVAAGLLDDDCFGLHFGASVDPREVGLLAYIGMSSRTLGDAIENLQRFMHVFTDNVELEITPIGDQVEINARADIHRELFHRQAAEASLAILLSAYRLFAKRTLTPVDVHFRHPRTTNLREFKRVFGCPVGFGTDRYGLVLKRADLSIPLASADDRLLEILRGYCSEILAKREVNTPPFLTEVEHQVMELLPKGKAKAKVVAIEMGMSNRTFSRRLADAGTSFAELSDQLRREVADTYLRNTEMSFTQVAFLLGYSEPSAFNHAFKRWTGQSPSEVRRSASGLAKA